jgi:methionyl-tRNA formyltransferase
MANICLAGSSDSYVLREYYSTLLQSEHNLCLLLLPPSPTTVAFENQRTHNLWHPPIARFDSAASLLSVDSLHSLDIQPWLDLHDVSVIIQSGCGIVRGPILSDNLWLNIHPGLLPRYRGCCCPEWQILNDHPLYSTAHLMTPYIDAGLIVATSKLAVPNCQSLAELRSKLYKYQSDFLLTLVDNLPLKDSGLNPFDGVDQALRFPKYSVMTKSQLAKVDQLIPAWSQKHFSPQNTMFTTFVSMT